MTGPGSATRKPRVEKTRPPNVMDLVVAAVCLVLGVVLPLRGGADPVTTAVTTVVGAGAAAAASLLGAGPRAVAWAVLIFGGLAFGSLTDLPRSWLATWVFAVLLGLLLGAGLLHLLRNRARSPEQDAAARAAEAATVRMTWDDGDDDRQALEPTPDQVVAAVRALDGERRTAVSVFRGTSRLDVAGDARGPMMVYQSDDRGDHRTHWHRLADHHPDDADDQVVVAVAGWPAHFPRRDTTHLDPAVRAAEHYTATGQRAPDLTWHSDGSVADMRSPRLQETD